MLKCLTISFNFNFKSSYCAISNIKIPTSHYVIPVNKLGRKSRYPGVSIKLLDSVENELPGWINCHFTLALLLRLIHHPSKMKRIFANLLTLSLIFMKCLLSHFFKQIKQMANQCLNQSLYFFFCSSPQLFSSLRLYLTLQLKFFDGIMFIFIIATTITILLFLIFLDLLSLKR